jgi:putative flippase GtrA
VSLPGCSYIDGVTPTTTPAGGRLSRSWQLLLRELSGFGVVGIVCFFIDVGLFQVLYAHVSAGAVTAKLVSTVVSMTIAYVGHRYWSFAHRTRTGVRREYVLFAAINGATLVLGLAIVAFVRYPLAQDGAFLLQVANLASIALGTLIRYFSYRRWVFPAHAELGVSTPGRAATGAVVTEDAA